VSDLTVFFFHVSSKYIKMPNYTDAWGPLLPNAVTPSSYRQFDAITSHIQRPYDEAPVYSYSIPPKTQGNPRRTRGNKPRVRCRKKVLRGVYTSTPKPTATSQSWASSIKHDLESFVSEIQRAGDEQLICMMLLLFFSYLSIFAAPLS
jgi:hypothetical protein